MPPRNVLTRKQTTPNSNADIPRSNQRKIQFLINKQRCFPQIPTQAHQINQMNRRAPAAPLGCRVVLGGEPLSDSHSAADHSTAEHGAGVTDVGDVQRVPGDGLEQAAGDHGSQPRPLHLRRSSPWLVNLLLLLRFSCAGHASRGHPASLPPLGHAAT